MPTLCKSITYNTADGHRSWRLGIGPCGKDVVALAADVSCGVLCIEQRTSCGEVKAFFIPLHSITSAITVEMRTDP